MNYYDNFNNYYNYKFQLLLSILNAFHGLSVNDSMLKLFATEGVF